MCVCMLVCMWKRVLTKSDLTIKVSHSASSAGRPGSTAQAFNVPTQTRLNEWRELTVLLETSKQSVNGALRGTKSKRMLLRQPQWGKEDVCSHFKIEMRSTSHIAHCWFKKKKNKKHQTMKKGVNVFMARKVQLSKMHNVPQRN